MSTKSSLVRGTLFWLPIIAVVLVLNLLGSASKPVWNTLLPVDINTFFASLLTILLFAVTGVLLGFSFVRKVIEHISKKVISRLPGLSVLSQKRKLSKELSEYQGALFPINDGIWVIGAVTGVQKMSYSGEEETVSIVPDKLYKGYAPSSPIPWSGFPIMFAEKEKVVFLDLSIGEIWNMTTSFGKSSPDVVSYLLNHATDHYWDE